MSEKKNLPLLIVSIVYLVVIILNFLVTLMMVTEGLEFDFKQISKYILHVIVCVYGIKQTNLKALKIAGFIFGIAELVMLGLLIYAGLFIVEGEALVTVIVLLGAVLPITMAVLACVVDHKNKKLN